MPQVRVKGSSSREALLGVGGRSACIPHEWGSISGEETPFWRGGGGQGRGGPRHYEYLPHLGLIPI